MTKHEAKMQAAFGRWLQHAYTGPTAAFELKRTLTNSLPLAALKDHQTLGLLQANRKLYYKLPDDSRSQKPFDCVILVREKSYLVVSYGERLQGFYMIPTTTIAALKEDGVVSITESMARELGDCHEIPTKK